MPIGIGLRMMMASGQVGVEETAPAAPSALAAIVASSTQINLTWQDNSDNEDNFELQYDTDSEFGTATTLEPAADATSQNVTSLSENTTYYFRIRAVNAAGNSSWSATAVATTSISDPSDIAGLRLWLDGSDEATLFTDAAGTTPVASDGDSVRRWEDKSANGYIFSSASIRGTYETGVQGGKSVVRTNATGALTPNASVPLNDRATLVLVATPTSGSDDYMTGGDGGGNTPAFIGGWSSISFEWFNNTDRATFIGAATGFNILVAQQVDSGVLKLIANGAASYRHRDAVAVGPRAINAIFATSASGNPTASDYAEVIVYDRMLTASELNLLGEYLAEKWGLTWEDYSAGEVTTPAFEPDDLDNLLVWLDGADSSTTLYDTGDPAEDGETVRQWSDKSGNNLHATANVDMGPKYRTNVIADSLPAIGLPGSHNLTFGTQPTLGSSVTLFVVATATRGSDDYLLTGNQGSAVPAIISGYSPGDFEWFNGADRHVFTAKGNTTWFHILCVRQVDGVSLEGWMDGGAAKFDVTPGVTLSGKKFVSIGGASTNQPTSSYLEIIVFNDELTDGEVDQVGEYLADKWGLSWTAIGPAPSPSAYPTLGAATVLFEGDGSKSFHTFQPCHETEIQSVNQGGFTYWAYYTIAGGAPYEIHLARSDSLTSGWVDYGKVFDGRWPSVYYDSGAGTFHMAYRQNSTSYGIRYATSSDGLSWTDQGMLVSDGNSPFLWKNPNDSQWYLFYHGKGGSGHRIRYRSASTIAGLAGASSVTLINQSAVIAAPAMMYHDSKYWLAVEILDSGVWKVESYAAAAIDGPYVENSNSPILTNDDACPISLLSDTDLYFFYAERTDVANDYWDVVVRTVDLS